MKQVQEVKSIESEKVFPSVKEPRSSLNGGRFFNDPRNNTREDPPKPATKSAPATKATSETIATPAAIETPAAKAIPTKPPRVTVTAKVIKPEHPMCPERKSSEGTPPKPPRVDRNGPPPKPPRTRISDSTANDESETKVKQSSVSISLKRPAPVPPTDDTTGKSEFKCINNYAFSKSVINDNVITVGLRLESRLR